MRRPIGSAPARGRAPIAIGLAATTLLVVALASPARSTETTARARARGLFGEVFVVDHDDGTRSMSFGAIDADAQSIVDPRDPRAVPMPYLRTAALGLALVDDDARVLLVGLGGGGFLAVTDAWPQARVTAVEIDPVVVSLARAHFGLDARRTERVVVDDGRAFLQGGEERGRAPWDLVFLDAYAGDDVPSALSDDAFFALVRGRLAASGVVVVNIAVDARAARDLLATIAHAFDDDAAGVHCLVAAVPEDENLVVLASKRPLSPPGLVDAAARVDRAARLPFSLAPLADLAIACGDRLRGRR